MKIKLLSPNASVPKKGSQSAAGYDLFAAEFGIIPPKERMLIKTGIVLEIPDGYYGRIAPRSGLALKHGIDTMAGVIDSDYRGEIGVILYNSGTEQFLFNIKDKIAQIIFEKHYDFNIKVVDGVTDTKRSFGGFGSTGK